MSGQLIIGIHAVRTALKHGAATRSTVCGSMPRESDRRLRQLLDEARASAGLQPEPSDKAALDRMTGGANHQGVVAQWRDAEQPGRVGAG